MSKKTVLVDIATAEFMLDLPEGTKIQGAKVDGEKLVLDLETEFDFPDNSTLTYEYDDFGNIALTGAQ